MVFAAISVPTTTMGTTDVDSKDFHALAYSFFGFILSLSQFYIKKISNNLVVSLLSQVELGNSCLKYFFYVMINIF